MKKIAVSILLFLNISIAHADDIDFTGGKLLTFCKSAIAHMDGREVADDDSINAAYCMGFLKGSMDAWTFDQVAENIKLPYDPPENVSIQQITRVFVKYMEENPEYMHISAEVVFRASLTRAFPPTK